MEKNNITRIFLILVVVGAAAVSGYLLLSPGKQPATDQNAAGFAPMVDGKQVLKMTVYADHYAPNYFKVKAGTPVRWEVTSSGQSGCDSGGVASPLLKDGLFYLNPSAGQVSVKEFTPSTAGTFAFNCPMNMVRGTIEVTNE